MRRANSAVETLRSVFVKSIATPITEIAGGPWSAGRKRKRISHDADREDTAYKMGFTIVRLESSARFKINEAGPLQIQAGFSHQWLKNLKRHTFNEPNKTVPTY